MLDHLLISFLAVSVGDPPAGPGAMAPNLASVGETTVLTWLEPVLTADGKPDRQRFRLRCVDLVDDTWGTPLTIIERDDFFANWADVPKLAASASGNRVVSWLQRSAPATYAYDAVVATRVKGSDPFTLVGPLHDDGTKTEHGFVSLVPEDGSVRAFWLDGREMASGGHDADDHGHGSGDMTLRTALVGEAIGTGVVLDKRVCECCNTTAAMTDAGPIVFYRDRGEDETRDISFVRRVDGGWTKPRPVHADGWRMAACPVNGPAAAARGSRLAVAWYTGATGDGEVRFAVSTDAGATFGAPVTIDDTGPMGRVSLALLDDDAAIVGWLDTPDAGGSDGFIKLVRVSPDGVVGPPLSLARVSLKRDTGFPRIAMHRGKLLVVWTDAEARRLRSRWLSPDELTSGDR